MRLTNVLCLSLAAVPLASAAQTWEKLLGPGLTYRMQVDLQTPRVIHGYRYSMGSTPFRAVPELASGSVYAPGEDAGRQAVSAIVQRTRAVAAVNGDFFPFTGDPLGAMVRDGELISVPDPRRAVLGWGKAGAKVALLKWQAQVTAPETEPIPLAGMNQECPEQGVTLNTAVAGLARAKGPSVHLVLKALEGKWTPTGRVQATVDLVFTDQDALPIQPGNAVLTGRGEGARRLAEIKPGSRITIDTSTSGFDWAAIEQVVGGGPYLVRGGKRSVDWQSAGFRPAFATERHPRTAAGVTANGDLWLVVVDGRQSISVGATLDELADVMRGLGCVEAMNLDGGGSSTINAFGTTLNRPSDGAERKVSNAVVFLLDPPTNPGDEGAAIRGPKTFLTGDSVSYTLLAPDGQPVPDREVIWAASGAAWIDQAGAARAIRPGAATITAVYRGRQVALSVQVEEPPSGPSVKARRSTMSSPRLSSSRTRGG